MDFANDTIDRTLSPSALANSLRPLLSGDVPDLISDSPALADSPLFSFHQSESFRSRMPSF